MCRVGMRRMDRNFKTNKVRRPSGVGFTGCEMNDGMIV